jgi:hypothetical protein
VLTYLVIKAGGREVNPVMLKLQRILPGKWTWLFLPKIAFIVAVWWAAGRYPAQMDVPFYGLIFLYGWVLVNNYRAWRKQS